MVFPIVAYPSFDCLYCRESRHRCSSVSRSIPARDGRRIQLVRLATSKVDLDLRRISATNHSGVASFHAGYTTAAS